MEELRHLDGNLRWAIWEVAVELIGALAILFWSPIGAFYHLASQSSPSWLNVTWLDRRMWKRGAEWYLDETAPFIRG